MNHNFTNDLIHETSPYLLQHAHNPVKWHAWSEAALAKAKQLDKPVLISIGYAACHWCHVMERESFENEKVAAYMNEHFINIKIDREERPDLDHIYMEAVQAIAGNGGWPLNVFLTTDAKPFYGGTYFPPEKAFNRASWKEVLFFVIDAWQNRRVEVEQQAATLLEHIDSSTNFISAINPDNLLEENKVFTAEKCTLIKNNILKSADTLYGGFGNAPKFPQTFSIQYLLAYSHHFKDKESLKHAEFSLQQLFNGGIYDQLAGGMARYSTDAQWLAPHFEKMLYDNALLVSVLCDAYQLTQKEIYKNAIEKTLDFLISEMKHPDGGFYAAIDADSEAVEGKFYVWDKSEIDDTLGINAQVFCDWYQVTEHGNWEGKNILHVTEPEEIFADKNNLSLIEFKALIAASTKILLDKRNQRIRPATDDKILLGWNALLLTAFSKSSAALGSEKYKTEAIGLFNFLNKNFSREQDIVYHSYKNRVARHPAYLDDYGGLIQGCIFLQQLIPGDNYLLRAKELVDYVIEHFSNTGNDFFYYTGKNQQDIITRKIEIYDNAVPSGNSLMAENLFYLSIVFDNREWWKQANQMIIKLAEIIIKHPLSFGKWANLIIQRIKDVHEIVITGKNQSALLSGILRLYLPDKVLLSAEDNKTLPLLKNKIYGDEPLIYLCKNYSCRPPVKGLSDFLRLLEDK